MVTFLPAGGDGFLSGRRSSMVRGFIVVLIVFTVACAMSAESENSVQGGLLNGLEIELAVEQIDESDAEHTGAAFEYDDVTAKLEWLFVLFEFSHRSYEWTGECICTEPGAVPWDSLIRISPGLQYYSEIGEKWGVWGKFVAHAGYESDMDSGSWTYNPQFLGFYSPLPGVKLYGGAGLLYHPVETVVYPVLGIAWNIDTVQGGSGALGFPETMVRYGFNEWVAVKADFEVDVRTYSLDEDSGLSPGGYVHLEDLKPAVYLELLPVDNLTLSAGIRYYLDRTMTLYDSNENEMKSVDVEDCPGFEFQIQYRF